MLRRKVWGVDLGRSAVKGAFLAATEDGVEVLKADIIPLEGPPPDPSQDPIRDGRLWRALREFQQKHKLHRDTTCVAIPAQNTFVRDLTIAQVGGRKVEEMVRHEAANEIPFVLDEVAWDYVLFGEKPDEPTRQGLLLAVKKNVIETYVRVFAQLEVGHVDLVTISPLALLNFLRLELGDQERAMALDIGAENTNMLALQDGRFWLRSMLSGGNRITALLQEEFGLSFEEAERAKENLGRSRLRGQIMGAVRPALHELVRNVKTNLSHLERSGGPGELDAVYVLGGAAKLAGIKESLGTALRQQVRTIEELKRVVVSPKADAQFIRANMDRLAVAIGAGLCGLGRDSTGVSFLPRSEMRVARISRSKGLLLGLGLVLWAAMLTAYALGRKAQSAVREPLRSYMELASIASENEQQLHQALQRAVEEDGLQRLLAAPAGRIQALEILNDVVAAFTAATRASPYAFRIATFQCTDVDAAAADAARRAGQARLQAGGSPETEPQPAEEPGPSWLAGEVSGLIIVPPRGGDPAEGYRRFIVDLLPNLRARPSLAKASGTATFTRNGRLVALERGAWSELVEPGDLIQAQPGGDWCVIDRIASDTELVLAEPFAGDDFQGPCLISQVVPVRFNEKTLEFALRFVVAKAPAPELAQVLEGTRP